MLSYHRRKHWSTWRCAETICCRCFFAVLYLFSVVLLKSCLIIFVFLLLPCILRLSVRKQAAEEAAMAAAATAAGPLPERTGSPADTAPTLELPQMEALHGDLFVNFKH